MTGDAFATSLALRLAPPLAIALVVQLGVFRRRGLLRSAHAPRVCAALLLTVLGSAVVAVVAALALPPGLVRRLAAHEFAFGGLVWSVAPLAILATAFAAAQSTWWTLYAARVRPPAGGR